MSNYQRVDIEQPLTPEGYCFVDSDGCEYAVDISDNRAAVFYSDSAHQFEMYAKDLPKMIKVLQAAYKQWESK